MRERATAAASASNAALGAAGGATGVPFVASGHGRGRGRGINPASSAAVDVTNATVARVVDTVTAGSALAPEPI